MVAIAKRKANFLQSDDEQEEEEEEEEGEESLPEKTLRTSPKLEVAVEQTPEVVRRPRGRPRKYPRPTPDVGSATESIIKSSPAETVTESPPTLPKRRGRPPRKTLH